MARTRAFEPDVALSKAMVVFWEKGYGDTSIEDLVEATGVSRYGLYAEWDGKHGLFLAALDKYKQDQIGFILSEMESVDASRLAVENFFSFFAMTAKGDGSRKGCMMANTAMEFGTADKQVAARVTKHFRRLEMAFRKCLKQAKADGEVHTDFEPDTAAIILAGIAQGLLVMVRAGEPVRKIEVFAKGALATLD